MLTDKIPLFGNLQTTRPETAAPKDESAGAASQAEISEAIQQIYVSEQAMRRELKETKERSAKMETELRAQLQAATEKNKKLEAEVSETRSALASRETQYGSLLSEKANITHKEANDRKYILEQLDQANHRYDHMVKQYDQMYKYCENLLANAEKRYRELEVEFGDIKSAQERAVSRAQDLEAALERSQQRYDEVRASCEDSRKTASLLSFEKSQLTNKLESSQQMLVLMNSHLERGRDLLGKTVRTMNDVHQSTRGFFESLESKGPNPLTLKAGRLLVEQWRMELDNLRKVGALFVELLEAQGATSNPDAQA